MWKAVSAIGVAFMLSACVDQAPYYVMPGPGKTYAQFKADDTACRQPGAGTSAVTGATYYGCMTTHGELVSAATPAGVYPGYAGAYPYAYPYPYAYGYPYGYPFGPGYVAPYVGVGLGFGIGFNDWGGGWDHGGHWRRDGFGHDGFGRGGGEHGGFGHGGGGFRR